MAEDLRYHPIHPETGISLPIRVRPEDFIKSKSHPHHPEYPSHKEAFKDYAGRALRRSRTQLLPDHMHSNAPGAYHHVIDRQENLPTDRHTKIRKTVLNIAGVIPRETVVLTGDGYEIQTLTDEEHAFISHPQITRVEGRKERNRQFTQGNIGYALIRYGLEQDLGGIASLKVQQEFLRTLDSSRERELGNQMIRAAIDQAIAPTIPIYEDARSEGMVDPRYMPLRAIVRDFVRPNDFGNYYELLRAGLAESNVVEFPTLQTEVDEVESEAA